MLDEFDIDADPIDIKKHWQARADKKRVGSLFQVRLDDEMTQELEHFIIKNGFNRNQALKHIIRSFLDKQ